VGPFSDYCAYQLNLSPTTVKTYRQYLGQISRFLGDPTPESIGRMEIFTLKATRAGHSGKLLYGLKTFLRYCRAQLKLTLTTTRAISVGKAGTP
jgi:hypothetical protein